MRNTLFTLALAALTGAALAHPSTAEAQQGFSLELRGSLNNPVGDFGDEGGLNATSEAGLGADLIYSTSPSFSLYGGWAREMFGCEGCADDDGIHSQGFEGGVKLLMARESGALPWIRGGLIAHELTVEDGAVEATSDMGLGFQASVGVDLPLGEVLSFTPALRYQTYEAEFDLIGDEIVAESTVQHLALDLGLHIHLNALGSR